MPLCSKIIAWVLCIKKHDIIAGNGRVLKAYMFIVWLYLFKNICNVDEFFLSFLLMHYIATFNGGCLQNYPTTTKISLQGNGMTAISKSTVEIWLLDQCNIQMVQTCLDIECS